MTGSACRPAKHLHGLEPIELADALRHLPGMVFFDSAGHLPAGTSPTLSMLAACPRQVLHGSIHEARDRQKLREVVNAGHAQCGDLGIPSGGLAGWVDYEGQFCFGEYPSMLVYDHTSDRWHETGTLSEQRQDNHESALSIGDFRPRCDRAWFLESVEKIRQWIAAGDIYQVNLAQAFEARVAGGSLFGLYRHLRDSSPAPMAAWLALAGREVLCSSPETFLKISGRRIETRPIKGTRPRFHDADDDLRSAYELQTSAKEIAELVMITDLLRNDIGQVCEFGSVEVEEMLRLESLAQVHHLVSTVSGRLRQEVDAVDALAACFPGGSITGAPKMRAMQIINELESAPRGIYCGAIGWLGYQGDAQFNIAIRTLVREGASLVYQTGAGIVADSEPIREYEETLHKAAGIRMALQRWQQSHGSALHSFQDAEPPA
ncbi:MAG: aminodeoxychorismate synthase component I [Luteolibacter sp.]